MFAIVLTMFKKRNTQKKQQVINPAVFFVFNAFGV